MQIQKEKDGKKKEKKNKIGKKDEKQEDIGKNKVCMDGPWGSGTLICCKCGNGNFDISSDGFFICGKCGEKTRKKCDVSVHKEE